MVKQVKYYKESNEEEDQAPITPNPVKQAKQKAPATKEEKRKNKYRLGIEIVVVVVSVFAFLIISYIFHCVWVAAEAYSSPSIIIANRDRAGNKRIVDDFREAYYWMRMNTKDDAKIISWWDYGYQISGMSNRAVIVDNNTWNTTHIAHVGAVIIFLMKQALANDEEESFRICKMLDADYVLLIFGGYSAYSGDDINKFIWIIRITGNLVKFMFFQPVFTQESKKIISLEEMAIKLMQQELKPCLIL